MISIADITMCSSEYCPYKNKCYRAQAKPSDYQSWSNYEYMCNEDNGFEAFIAVKHLDES